MTDKAWFQREWTIESKLGQEKGVMSELRGTFRELQLEEPRIEEIVTAVSEACLNAIEHGNRLIQHLPVGVNLLIQGDRYLFRITDEGSGTIPDEVNSVAQVGHKINWDNPRGWGLQLMSQYADSLHAAYLNGKFCVELHFLREGLKGVDRDEG